MRKPDREAIERALDRIAGAHPKIRKLSAELRREQRRLRQLVSEKAWLSYMAVEEITNDRHRLLVDEAVRLAFCHSRKALRRSVE